MELENSFERKVDYNCQKYWVSKPHKNSNNPIRFKGLPKYRCKHWHKKCQGTQFGQAIYTVIELFKDLIISKMFLFFPSSFEKTKYYFKLRKSLQI